MHVFVCVCVRAVCYSIYAPYFDGKLSVDHRSSSVSDVSSIPHRLFYIFSVFGEMSDATNKTMHEKKPFRPKKKINKNKKIIRRTPIYFWCLNGRKRKNNRNCPLSHHLMIYHEMRLSINMTNWYFNRCRPSKNDTGSFSFHSIKSHFVRTLFIQQTKNGWTHFLRVEYVKKKIFGCLLSLMWCYHSFDCWNGH